MIRRPPRSTRPDTLFPYTTLFRSGLRVIVKSVLSATIRERSMHGSKSARFKALRPIAGACLAVASVTAWASDLQLLRVTPAGNDVPAQSQIVFAFDRDVVPLGRMARDASADRKSVG